jgi:hypothetical protein
MTSTSRSEPAFIKLIPMREERDCVIGVLASFLGASYEDTLRAAMLAVPNMRKDGYTSDQIRRIAANLDHPLVFNKSPKRWSLDSSIGILMFRDHVAILWRGSIWDPNNTLWQAQHYLTHYNYVPLGLFTLKKETP